MGEKTARQLLSLTPEKVREGHARLFGAAIGAARVSPRLARLVPLPDDLDSQTSMTRGILQNPALRFLYERSIAQNLLLQGALELRAQKLKNGAYPGQIQAPRDPFAPDSRLIYRRQGETYRLYSVGPDGKDNGGRAIVPQKLVFDADSGTSHWKPAKSAHFDSRGDIPAPVF